MSQQDGYVVAVLGATGLVGSHLIEILEERNFPVKTLKPLASTRSAGGHIHFKGECVDVIEATPDAFDGVDIVLASAGASVSEKLAPEAVKRGAVVIDNTSLYRLDPNVPLVVGGVNDDALKNHQGIIANPNCSTAQLMPVLKAIHEKAGLSRVIVSTYQSVSGAGKEGIEELLTGVQEFFDRAEREGGNLANEKLAQPMSTNKVFQRPIAFNLIPHIDVFMTNETAPGCEGYTKEETKLISETRKILELPDLKITATAVRVPVMVGHSESVTVELDNSLSPAEAASLLSSVNDIVVSDSNEAYPTPIEATGKDPVYVGRIREDNSNPGKGLHLWVVADNLRIGAALNAVRIAEALVKNQWLTPQTATC